MKRTWIILLCLCLLLTSVTLFSACDEESKQNEDPTEANTDPEDSTTFDENTPYVISYTSNGDGTCYVSAILTNSSYIQDFELNIPETSPDGDRVTAVQCAPFLNGAIPQIIAAEDFEKIDQALQALVQKGELDEFYYKKATTYFTRRSLNDAQTPNAQKELLEKYPVTSVTDIYTYAIDSSLSEDQFILECLEKISYTQEQLSADSAHLYQLVNSSGSTEKELIKKSLDESLPFCSGDRITAIRLPRDIQKVSLSLFKSCKNIKDLVIPAAITEILYGAFAEREALVSVKIEGKPTILWRAFENCVNLKSISFVNAEDAIELGEGCFAGCTALEKVLFTSGAFIPQSAFEGCSSLQTVYTVQEKTTVSDQGNNAYQAAKIYSYSETQPTTEGNYWRFVDGEPTPWTAE